MPGHFWRTTGRRRSCLFAAASALYVTGTVLALTAEQPAAASEHSAGFEQAFADLEMSEQDATPALAVTLAAERRYENAPLEDESPSEDRVLGTGNASYYGAKFAGRRTASGENFDPTELTAAHRTLPFGSRVKVTNRRNGRSVIVRINDRGPFHGKRVIDLSREAAKQIGLLRQGHGQVDLALVPS